ncbi:MAG: MBL fold metallo-hydrolase [Clostridia bacterium]|nr:MBL fold metallo-hydrolase [Clostridia bacterium]
MGRRRSKPKAYATIQSVQEDVTGSRTLVVITFSNGNKFRLLVDCGMYQGSVEEYAKNGSLGFINAELIDAVLLTHAHVDHSGQIPLLYANGANCNVYMSQDTKRICIPLLENTCQIFAQDNNPMYNENDLNRAIHAFETIEYDEWVELKNLMNMPSGVSVKFIRNEHIPGAASICVQVSPENEESFRLMFSGDYNMSNAFSNRITTMPEDIKKNPIAFFMMEATYGRKTKKNMVVGKFENDVEKYIGMGKSIIVTAFANMRMQNCLYLLRQMQDKGTLSTDIPIYIDGGMGEALTNIWPILNTVDIKDFLPQNFHRASTDKKKLIDSEGQFILVTTSGMGNFGPSKEYLSMAISKDNMVIYFSGYVSNESTARRIIDAKLGDILDVNGAIKEKRAISDYTEEMSAHARAEDLQSFIEQFHCIRTLVWNHGSNTSKLAMKERSDKMENVDVSTINDGKIAFKVDKDGLVKEFTIVSIPVEKSISKQPKRAPKRNKKCKTTRRNKRATGY